MTKLADPTAATDRFADQNATNGSNGHNRTNGTNGHAKPTSATAAPLVAEDDADLSQEERDYLFDLNGYRIIQNALTPDQLARVNAFVDAHPIESVNPGDWVGDVECHTYGSKDGLNFQNIIEGGDVFEELIDNPTWLPQVRRYIENGAHKLAIEENFLNVRRSGGFIPIHAGGANIRFTGLFQWQTGAWAVGQINVLMALTDVGPGDGATTVAPGSHKSQFLHPNMDWNAGVGGDRAIGMREVHLKAGQALMFTDGITHGSTPRTNPGERRVLIYRYSPHLLANRFNYIPSPELLARLTPERRKLVEQQPPRGRPGRSIHFTRENLPKLQG